MRLLSSIKVFSISGGYAIFGVLGGGLLLAGCGDDASSAGSCEPFEDQLGFSEDSSMAFSMADVLSGRRDQTATLTWGEPKDWLPHPGEGETELVVRLRPTSSQAVELRNEDTDCGRRLQIEVEADLSTSDSVFVATADGLVRARSEDVFELEVELEAGDLEGTLRLTGESGLVLQQTVDGDDVDGQLRAWRQESSANGSSQLRTGTLASWQGSVGAAPVDGNDDDAAGEPEAGIVEPPEEAGITPTPSEAGVADVGDLPVEAGDAATTDAATTGAAASDSGDVPEAGAADAEASAGDSGSADAG